MREHSRRAFPKIEERTLYPPIVQALKEMGFDTVGESKVNDRHPDILFTSPSPNQSSFVIEVKIGKAESGLKATAQAYDYAKSLGTENIIILIFPEALRNQVILDAAHFDRMVMNETVKALVLTEFWTESVEDRSIEILRKIKSFVSTKSISIDFHTIVGLIRDYVVDLDYIVHQINTDQLVSEVVNKLDLFSALGDIKESDVARKQVVSLASYLLFNQLLFYHVYVRKVKSSGAKKIDSKKIPDELGEISSIENVQAYFDQITEIDYEAIYAVDILGHVPNKRSVITTLNNLIKSIKLLRAEHITQDLAGRFFHELIPTEIRKVLAAFYTHPIAAEILAGLSITEWDCSVIDPACGSGTLLVSAYLRKMDIYKRLFGYKNLNDIHQQFIQKDITGFDIMPFAAHITTLNLSTQNIDEKTNVVRIACSDSLGLSSSLRTESFKKSGITFKSYNTVMQQTLFEAEGSQVVSRSGSLSPQGSGEGFTLMPVDVVIMNPPFSDRNKMPHEMRERLANNDVLRAICGNDVNLWGYFLALSNYLVRDGGKIAVVIPINIARGEATRKIRTYLFKNFSVEFIVKPVADFAFSEGASFKDVLYIARKAKPIESKTRVVYLKKSIRKTTAEAALGIVSKIKELTISEISSYEDADVAFNSILQSELISQLDNLMPYVGGASPSRMETMRSFMFQLDEKYGSKLVKFKASRLKEGITSPRGLGQLIYVTRPVHSARLQNAWLVLSETKQHDIKVNLKNSEVVAHIPKSAISPALRTLTGIQTMDISGNYDFIVLDGYHDFDKLLLLSKWKGEFDWSLVGSKVKRLGGSHLVIPDKIRLSSENTSLIGIYSDEPLILANLFFAFEDTNKDRCKILCLSLNSILTLVQFLLLKSETLGGYIRLAAADWGLTRQLNYDVLNRTERAVLLEAFDKIKGIEFPSLLNQLETNYWARVYMDKTILSILGFERELIDDLLPKLYRVVAQELRSTNEMESK